MTRRNLWATIVGSFLGVALLGTTVRTVAAQSVGDVSGVVEAVAGEWDYLPPGVASEDSGVPLVTGQAVHVGGRVVLKGQNGRVEIVRVDSTPLLLECPSRSVCQSLPPFESAEPVGFFKRVLATVSDWSSESVEAATDAMSRSLAGLTVHDGVLESSAGVLLGTDRMFASLPPGRYWVRFDPAAAAQGAASDTQGAGADCPGNFVIASGTQPRLDAMPSGLYRLSLARAASRDCRDVRWSDPALTLVVPQGSPEVAQYDAARTESEVISNPALSRAMLRGYLGVLARSSG